MGALCAVGLAALFMTPCDMSAPAAAQTYKVQTAKKVKAGAVRRVYSPSGNPDWDVYVKGAYVGSDPDPRIRWTLAKEAHGGYGTKN